MVVLVVVVVILLVVVLGVVYCQVGIDKPTPLREGSAKVQSLKNNLLSIEF